MILLVTERMRAVSSLRQLRHAPRVCPSCSGGKARIALDGNQKTCHYSQPGASLDHHKAGIQHQQLETGGLFVDWKTADCHTYAVDDMVTQVSMVHLLMIH